MCLGSSFATILSMSSLVILTEDSLSFVKGKVGGSCQLLLIKERWFAKNGLNISAFFLKSVIYSFFQVAVQYMEFFASKETFRNGSIIPRTFTNVR